MLGGSVKSEVRASEPSPTCQDPETKAPHQDLPRPNQPAASGSVPSRPRRRPPPQRPHRCPDCPKAFSYPSKLATHRLAHGGTRPHPCPDCPKAFSYPSKLAAHRLTHSGARPHSCPHCPKAFGHRSKLAAHLWTHAPARPYPCPDCPKSFCYPSKLAAHRHTHHRRPPLPLPALPQSVLVSFQTGGPSSVPRPPNCAQQPGYWQPPMLQLQSGLWPETPPAGSPTQPPPVGGPGRAGVNSPAHSASITCQ